MTQKKRAPRAPIRGRLLALISWCERNRGGKLPGRKIVAEALGTSVNSLNKDIDYLRDLAYIEGHGTLNPKNPHKKYRVLDSSLMEATR